MKRGLGIALLLESIALALLLVITLRVAGPAALGSALQQVGEFVARVAWPVIVLTIFTMFRGPIRQFIAEMAEVTFPGGSAKRGDAAARQLRDEANAVVAEAAAAQSAHGQRQPNPTPMQELDEEPPMSTADEGQAPTEESSVVTWSDFINPATGELDLRTVLQRIDEARDLESSFSAVLFGYDIAAAVERQLAGGTRPMSYSWRRLQLRKAGAPNEILALGAELRRVRNQITSGRMAVTPVGGRDYLAAVHRYVLALASWKANSVGTVLTPSRDEPDVLDGRVR